MRSLNVKLGGTYKTQLCSRGLNYTKISIKFVHYNTDEK